MPLKFSPPGSFRFRGRIRAQVTRAVTVQQSILNYNTKLRNNPIPTNFLTDAQAATIATQIVFYQSLLTLKN